MMLGARTAAWVNSGGWVNPYVTDGLIAMWDGEWNAGGGVHNDTVEVWKDVVSGIDADLYYGPIISNVIGSPKVEVFNKYIRMCGYSFVAKLDDFFNNILNGDGITVEIVGAMLESQNGYGGIFGAGSFRNNARRFLYVDQRTMDSPNTGVGGLQYRASSWIRDAAIKKMRFDVKKIYSMIVQAKGSSAKIMANGVSGNHTTTGSYLSYDASDRIKLGGRGESSGNCDLYCVRIYKGIVTDDIIAANYAVDKVRFNLP